MDAIQFLNWHIACAALSGVLEVVSFIPYVRDMVRGQTRPNAVSFGIWAALQGVALAAQLKAGPSWSAIMMGGLTLSATTIAILALKGYGYRRFDRIDKICLGIAVLAIAALLMSPVFAIGLAIIGDLCAVIPTVRKVYREPHTEHAGAWGLITLGTFFGTLSTEIIDVANLAFPIYVTIVCGSIYGLAYFGQKRSPRLAS
jgi:hypothetical protein